MLNSLIFRLKTGCRYRDLPRTPKYAAPSTTHYWLKRWTAAGLFKHLWRRLLGVLKAKGELSLTSGSLDGSFVPAKRGATDRQGSERERLDVDGSFRGMWIAYSFPS